MSPGLVADRLPTNFVAGLVTGLIADLVPINIVAGLVAGLVAGPCQ